MPLFRPVRLSLSLVVALGAGGAPFAAAAGAATLDGRVTGLPPGGGPAVVWIEGAHGGTVPHREAVITHKPGGAFEPALSIGYVGSDFVFRNEDDKLHNTHLYLQLAHQKEVSSRPLKDGATVYNIALPRKGMEVRRPIRPYHAFTPATGYIAIQCNAHPEERASMLVFGHPWSAVTDAEGRFQIPDVPAGQHEIWIWHGGKVGRWKSIELGGKGSVVIDLATIQGAE